VVFPLEYRLIEDRRLISREIIFNYFRRIPIYVIVVPQRHRRTDGRSRNIMPKIHYTRFPGNFRVDGEAANLLRTCCADLL